MLIFKLFIGLLMACAYMVCLYVVSTSDDLPELVQYGMLGFLYMVIIFILIIG